MCVWGGDETRKRKKEARWHTKGHGLYYTTVRASLLLSCARWAVPLLKVKTDTPGNRNTTLYYAFYEYYTAVYYTSTVLILYVLTNDYRPIESSKAQHFAVPYRHDKGVELHPQCNSVAQIENDPPTRCGRSVGVGVPELEYNSYDNYGYSSLL